VFEWADDTVELRPCDVLPAYQVGGSSGSRKEILGDSSLTSVLTEPDHEPELGMSHCYYTNLITGDTGEVFKFNGKIVEPGEEKAAHRFRHCYRIEKVGSELTKEEEAEWYDLVRKAKKKELSGIMKHDAMRCEKKLNCSTKSIASRWVLTWKMVDGTLDVKARLVIKGFLDPQLNQIITASATASA
jgi:hypothetical protein